MDVSQETVEKVQRFAEKRQRAEDFYENQEINPAVLQAYNRKLDETLKELQDQVKRQEDDLRRVCTHPWRTLARIHPKHVTQLLTHRLAARGQLLRSLQNRRRYLVARSPSTESQESLRFASEIRDRVPSLRLTPTFFASTRRDIASSQRNQGFCLHDGR